MSETKTVLVTGTSSGIGQATARLLAQSGCAVFGGSLTPDQDERIPGVMTLPLDVRSDASVRSCVAGVLGQAGRLDALVNNAGYALGGALEEASLGEAQAQFDTNFFGIVRMTHAVLPQMRKQRSGQIINISSGAGVTASPFIGFYSASKFAVEGFSEALYHEIRPFRIRVSLVEPGWFRTSISMNALQTSKLIDDYGPGRRCVETAAERCAEGGGDPIEVARCILKILRSGDPRLRYRVGKDVTSSFWLRRLLPERLYLWMIARYYGLT
jgi:NAD(P)-dependent dehydrogenase (short-subunit alcohol dehydrogenase family)